MTTPALDDPQCDAPPGASRALPSLLALLIYLALAATLMHGALFGDDVMSPGAHFAQSGPFPAALRANVPPGIDLLSDRVTQFMPWLRYAADHFAADGHLPLWKSLASCGAPLVGNGQSALYFPPNLLAVVLGAPAWVFAGQALLKLVGGAGFAFLLARHLRMSFLAALLAGLVFGFGGFEVVFLQHPHTNVSMLLPLLLLAADRVALDPTRGRIALLGLVAGLQHLGGHAETAVHCQLAAVALGGARAWSLRRQQTPAAAPSRRLAGVVGGLALGAALGAIQILPQLEYIAESEALVLRSRSAADLPELALWPRLGFLAALAVALLGLRHLARGGRRGWLVAPTLALAVFLGLRAGAQGGLSPLFIAPFASDWFGGVQAYFGSSNYVELNGAFAGAALPLALLGLLAGAPRGPVRAAGVLLGVGLLALFTAPGMNELLRALPGLKLAVNTRFSLLALLATAVLAGFGLDVLGRGARAVVGARYAAILLALLAGASGALVTSVRSGEFVGQTVPSGYTAFTAHPLPVSVIGERLPRSLVARFLDSATALNEPYTYFTGWFEAPGRVTAALVLHGPANRAAPALCTPALQGGEGGTPMTSADGDPIYMYVSAVPSRLFPAGRSTVRLRVSFADGSSLHSGPVSSLDEPELTAWPFPAQPGSGQAWSQVLLLLVAGACCATLVSVTDAARRAARLALVALIAASLLPFTAGMLPLLPQGAFYPRSGALDRLRHIGPDARMLSMSSTALSAEIPTWYGIPDVRGYDALHPRRVARLLRQATDVEPWTWPMEILPHRDDPDLRLLGLMAVGFITGWTGAPPELPREPYPGESMLPTWAPFPIVGNPHFLPRARLLSGVVVEPDDERALAALSAPDFPAATTVVLERGMAAAAEPSSEPAGSAQIVQDLPDVVRVAVEPSRPGQLVLADTFFPGWTARVDGNEREIVRANLAFRAVAVAPGDRLVEFRYEPLWHRIGFWVSGSSGLLLLALGLGRRRP